jgi:poly(hydroxyalkanoate) granule-associated protein
MDTNAEAKKESEKEEEYSLHDMMKRMMLAGVGAVSIIHEELEKHIDKLVERGEITQKDREEMMSKMKERRQEFMHHRREHAQKYVTDALEHLDIPSRSDIDNLSKKITNLEKKIDELNKPSS